MALFLASIIYHSARSRKPNLWQLLVAKLVFFAEKNMKLIHDVSTRYATPRHPIKQTKKKASLIVKVVQTCALNSQKQVSDN
jgi:hypothetical protein